MSSNVTIYKVREMGGPDGVFFVGDHYFLHKSTAQAFVDAYKDRVYESRHMEPLTMNILYTPGSERK